VSVVEDHEEESREPLNGFVESVVSVSEEWAKDVVLVDALEVVVLSRLAGLAAVTA